MVPALARLDQVKTQEVLVDISVPEAVTQKLEVHGLGAREHDLVLTELHAKCEAVVQYAESDLAFVTRLTEHLGISYYFASTEAGTRVVFTDHEAGFGSLGAITSGDHGDAVYTVASVRRRVPSTVFVQDQNYRAPLVELTASADVPGGAGGGIVEYAAHHRAPNEGAALAGVRARPSVRSSSFSAGPAVARASRDSPGMMARAEPPCSSRTGSKTYSFSARR